MRLDSCYIRYGVRYRADCIADNLIVKPVIVFEVSQEKTSSDPCVRCSFLLQVESRGLKFHNLINLQNEQKYQVVNGSG